MFFKRFIAIFGLTSVLFSCSQENEMESLKSANNQLSISVQKYNELSKKIISQKNYIQKRDENFIKIDPFEINKFELSFQKTSEFLQKNDCENAQKIVENDLYLQFKDSSKIDYSIYEQIDKFIHFSRMKFNDIYNDIQSQDIDQKYMTQKEALSKVIYFKTHKQDSDFYETLKGLQGCLEKKNKTLPGLLKKEFDDLKERQFNKFPAILSHDFELNINNVNPKDLKITQSLSGIITINLEYLEISQNGQNSTIDTSKIAFNSSDKIIKSLSFFTRGGKFFIFTFKNHFSIVSTQDLIDQNYSDILAIPRNSFSGKGKQKNFLWNYASEQNQIFSILFPLNKNTPECFLIMDALPKSQYHIKDFNLDTTNNQFFVLFNKANNEEDQFLVKKLNDFKVPCNVFQTDNISTQIIN